MITTARQRARSLRSQGFDLDEIVKVLGKEKHRSKWKRSPSRASVHRWIRTQEKPTPKDGANYRSFYDSVRGILTLPIPTPKKLEAIQLIFEAVRSS